MKRERSERCNRAIKSKLRTALRSKASTTGVLFLRTQKTPIARPKKRLQNDRCRFGCFWGAKIGYGKIKERHLTTFSLHFKALSFLPNISRFSKYTEQKSQKLAQKQSKSGAKCNRPAVVRGFQSESQRWIQVSQKSSPKVAKKWRKKQSASSTKSSPTVVQWKFIDRNTYAKCDCHLVGFID